MYRFQIDEFVGKFPLWLVVRNGRRTGREDQLKVDGVLTRNAGGAKTVAIFSDFDLAGQCARQMKLADKAGISAVQIASPDDMIQFLTEWSDKGQEIAFDPSPLGERPGTPFPITGAIEAFRRCTL